MIPRLRLSDGAGSASGRTQESVAAAGCPGQPKAGPGRALIILAASQAGSQQRPRAQAARAQARRRSLVALRLAMPVPGRGPPRCSGLLSILATQPQLPLGVTPSPAEPHSPARRSLGPRLSLAATVSLH